MPANPQRIEEALRIVNLKAHDSDKFPLKFKRRAAISKAAAGAGNIARRTFSNRLAIEIVFPCSF